jgi:hypothetical protein
MFKGFLVNYQAKRISGKLFLWKMQSANKKASAGPLFVVRSE